MLNPPRCPLPPTLPPKLPNLGLDDWPPSSSRPLNLLPPSLEVKSLPRFSPKSPVHKQSSPSQQRPSSRKHTLLKELLKPPPPLLDFLLLESFHPLSLLGSFLEPKSGGCRIIFIFYYISSNVQNRFSPHIFIEIILIPVFVINVRHGNFCAAALDKRNPKKRIF